MNNKYQKVDVSSFLTSVDKPSRYIGLELNSKMVMPSEDKVNVCFAFPDLYEVGFSHLGLKILYSIINEEENSIADRVYAPWPDMGKMLKDNNKPLFALESKVAIKEFDLLGFTLQSELNFSNVIYMLDLAGIPYYSKDRTGFPIIIGGGPSITNPAPLEKIFDAILIGEGEEAILEVKDLIAKHGRDNKELILQELAKCKGWYVPKYTQGTVVIRKYWDFSKNTAKHSNQLIAWQQATHDRYVAEIMRGCSRGCRFCHAGYFYRPVRERDAQDILQDMLIEIQQNGWEEVNLSSLSSSDYFCIKPLLTEMKKRLGESETKVSLPSLRVDTLDDSLITLVESLGRTGLTIAPEAGSQRLRDIINKNITEADILEGIDTALRFNWQLVKLYFMIGLPGEQPEDIEALIELIYKIMDKAGKKLQINVSISPFVPKPHTPFQWADVLDREELLSRAIHIKKSFKRYKFIKVKYHEIESSLLEAIFARGDSALNKALIKGYENGCIFDGWREYFDFSKWENTFAELNIDYSKYISNYTLDSKLPWENISLNIKPEFLLSELEKSHRGETTEGCLTYCTDCGICNSEHKLQLGINSFSKLPADLILQNNAQEPLNDGTPRYFYRIYYKKQGILKYVGHLDLMRMIYRMLRKSNLKVIYTQGFNQHPKIKLAPPLPLGIEGFNEFFEIQSNTNYSCADILNAFSFVKYDELSIFSVKRLSKSDKRNLDAISSEVIKVIPTPELALNIIAGVKAYEEADKWIMTKEKKTKTVEFDIKENIHDLKVLPDGLLITKKLIGLNIFDILAEVFNIEREATAQFLIIRDQIIIPDDVVEV